MLLVAAALTAGSSTTANARTAPISDACILNAQADAELNKVYQQVRKEYGPNSLFIQKLKLAQKAWLAFRDAHVASLFPEKDKRAATSGYGECVCLATTELTSKRTDELRQWLKVTPTEEGCALLDSIKVK